MGSPEVEDVPFSLCPPWPLLGYAHLYCLFSSYGTNHMGQGLNPVTSVNLHWLFTVSISTHWGWGSDVCI